MHVHHVCWAALNPTFDSGRAYMRQTSMLIGSVCALLGSFAIIGPPSLAQDAGVPPYLKSIVRPQAATPAEVGTKDILQLNATMFELYDDTSKIFRRNLLAQHPVILGLFTGAGGRFILYRPGVAPVDAPPVPIIYIFMNSISHSQMAQPDGVLRYLDSP